MSDDTDTGHAEGEGVTLAARSAACRIWAQLLGKFGYLSDAQTKVSERGFVVGRPDVVERFEAIGRHFAWGYNHALRSCSVDELADELAAYPIDEAGFAYEGAAMGLVIADWMTPGRRMFDAYVNGPARAHEYMAWVGLGWALARLPVSPTRTLTRYRNLNKWLAVDGYGFHEGYFNWRRSVVQHRVPRGLAADAAQVFDQGLGRSLWFVRGADPSAVTSTIASFEAARHGDLWSGIGLAVAYAGSATQIDLQVLRTSAGSHEPELAQGVVFAAEARRRAGNPVAHTELACNELLGLSCNAAADIAVETLPTEGDSLRAYRQWRRAIQQRCGSAQTL